VQYILLRNCTAKYVSQNLVAFRRDRLFLFVRFPTVYCSILITISYDWIRNWLFIKKTYIDRFWNHNEINEIGFGENRKCRRFRRFFCDLWIVFPRASEKYWENRKTRQIKYWLDRICCRKTILHVKIIAFLCTTMFADKMRRKKHIIFKTNTFFASFRI